MKLLKKLKCYFDFHQWFYMESNNYEWRICTNCFKMEKKCFYYGNFLIFFDKVKEYWSSNPINW